MQDVILNVGHGTMPSVIDSQRIERSLWFDPLDSCSVFLQTYMYKILGKYSTTSDFKVEMCKCSFSSTIYIQLYKSQNIVEYC